MRTTRHPTEVMKNVTINSKTIVAGYHFKACNTENTINIYLYCLNNYIVLLHDNSAEPLRIPYHNIDKKTCDKIGPKECLFLIRQ